MKLEIRHPYIALLSFLLAFGLHINIEAKADVEELMMKDLQMMKTVETSSPQAQSLPKSTPVVVTEEIEIQAEENEEVDGTDDIDDIETTNKLGIKPAQQNQ